MDLNDGCEYDVVSNASSSSRARKRPVKQGRSENLLDLKGATERWVIDEGADGGENIDGPSLDNNVEKGYQDLNRPNVEENGLRRFGRMPERRFRGNDEIDDLREDRRRHIERNRYSASISSLEGPSNNYLESSYGRGEQLKTGYSGHELNNLGYSGDNRTELLRKIDELKDHLSRSSMAEKHTEPNPHHTANVHYRHYSGSEDWISASSSEKYRPFMQYSYPDYPSAPTSYMNQYAESSAYMNMHAIGGSHFGWTDNIADKPMEMSSQHLQNLQNDHHYNASDDRFSDWPTSKNRRYIQHPFRDQNPPAASFMNRYAEPAHIYMDRMDWRTVDIADRPIRKNPDHLRIVHGGNYKASEESLSTSGVNMLTKQYPFPDRHPEASYINRYGEPPAYTSMHVAGSFHDFHPPQNIRSHVQVVGDPDQRFLDIPHNALSSHYENPGSFVLHNYGPKATSGPQVQSENLPFHTRFASEVDSEVTSLASRQRPRLQPITASQHCRPIGRGAPLIACTNCFESLHVPKRAIVEDGVQKKMRCGSCSSMIVVDISKKNFLVSIYEAKEVTPDTANDNIKLIEGNSQARGHTNRESLTFSFEDYDHSGYDFQSMDKEPTPRMTNQQVVAESVRTKSVHSTPSYSAEGATQDPLATSRRSSSPTELSTKVETPPPPTGSSLQEYFEYSNKYHRGDHLNKGNRCSDQKTTTPNISASRKYIITDASEATEMDLSSNEFGNTESSLDPGVPRTEGGQSRLTKAAEAFFAGNDNESFRDSINSNLLDEHDEDNVTINGHLIPNRLIKNAEKLSGPVQPGNYWYDFRAGFWGIIGGPCLGIIPPSIEEFRYQMPENCAGGNTSVYVNGRELHQNDLNLLVSRGLPNDKNRYYNIKISGNVLDEMTGEKLPSLGNLAPT